MRIISFLMGVLIIGSVFAHEYILIVSKYKVNKGDTLEVHLFVADGFNIELERPLQKGIRQKFELITASTKTDLLAAGKEGDLPILNAPVDFEGLGLLHMERDYSRISLENAKFKDYLKEDHIENITIDERKKMQSERYTRYIKALVQSGKPNAGDQTFKAVAGQAYEIVLLDNPYVLKTGSTIRAQLLFKGKPLIGKMVTARNRTGGEAASKQLSRTDKNGICRFVINRKGDWFLHSTHMIACPDPADADWESFWTSYSFGVE